MPLQLCISSLPLAGRHQQPPPQHPVCCIAPAAPRLPPRAQVPRATTDLHPCRSKPRERFSPSQTTRDSAPGSPSWVAFNPPSSAQLSHPPGSPSLLHRPRSPGRYSRCHPSSPSRGHMAGTSFPFCRPLSSPETTSRSRPALPPQHLLALAQIPWSLIPRLPSPKASGLPAALCAPTARRTPPPFSPGTSTLPSPQAPPPFSPWLAFARQRMDPPEMKLADASSTPALLTAGLGRPGCN